jgi:hypothetical protein
MNNFLNFILLGKGMMIRPNIGRKNSLDERDGMIMDSMGRGKLLGGGKKNMVVGEDILCQCFMETYIGDLAKAYTNKNYQEKEERYTMKNEE